MRDFETRAVFGEIEAMMFEALRDVREHGAEFLKSEGCHRRICRQVRIPGLPVTRLQIDVLGYDEYRSPPSIVDRLEKDLANFRARAEKLENEALVQAMYESAIERRRKRERHSLLRRASK